VQASRERAHQVSKVSRRPAADSSLAKWSIARVAKCSSRQQVYLSRNRNKYQLCHDVMSISRTCSMTNKYAHIAAVDARESQSDGLHHVYTRMCWCSCAEESFRKAAHAGRAKLHPCVSIRPQRHGMSCASPRRGGRLQHLSRLERSCLQERSTVCLCLHLSPVGHSRYVKPPMHEHSCLYGSRGYA